MASSSPSSSSSAPPPPLPPPPALPPPPSAHLLPRSVLEAPTPSALDGVSAALERAHRLFGCELAQEMCVLLCMPQHCAATAQSLLQRFYFRRSLALFDAHVVAMACVFLAGKVEEHTRAMRDVLNVCYSCKLRRQGRPPRALQRGGELYAQWKAGLIRCERFVLIDVGFQMYAVSNEHPHKVRPDARATGPAALARKRASVHVRVRPAAHRAPVRSGRRRHSAQARARALARTRNLIAAPPRPLPPRARAPPLFIASAPQFILYYVRALGGGDALAQSAWSYLNDSLRLDLCCRHAAETIACAALLLAARDTRFALPAGVPWTQVFSSSRAEVEAVAARIDSLYDEEARGAAAAEAAGGDGGAAGAGVGLERWPQSLIVAAAPVTAAATAPAPAMALPPPTVSQAGTR